MFNRRIGIIASLMGLMAGLGLYDSLPERRERGASLPPRTRFRSRAGANQRKKPRGRFNNVYCRAAHGASVKYVPSIVRIDGIAHRHEFGRLVPRK